MGESQGGTYCENDRCIKKPKFTSAICFSKKFWANMRCIGISPQKVGTVANYTGHTCSNTTEHCPTFCLSN